MKVVIAGSRRLPRGQAPKLLIRFLANLADVDTVLLRSPLQGSPGEFEQDVLNLCKMLHLPHMLVMPNPTDKHPGRASVYVRDIDMIEESDLVLLFFAPEEATTGYSGTAHLLDKALDAGRACYAYAVSVDGQVTRVGEYDPANKFADLVPAA